MSPRSAARRIVLISALLALLLASAVAQPMDTQEITDKSHAEVERRLLESHPAHYFTYASRLWSEDRRDDAVFWLYVAQLRYRFHLAAHPPAEPGGEAALLGSLLATVGEPVNRYAGGDIANWRKQIARALRWDRDNANRFTSKKEFAKKWQETRAGLEKLSSSLEQNAESFKKQRAEMLLRDSRPSSEKTAVSHPQPLPSGVARPRIKMPADWPALNSHTTVEMITGNYEGGVSSPFARAFFVGEQGRILGTTTFELVALDEQRLRVRALRGKRSHERVVDIQSTNDGIVFTESAIDQEAGLQLGVVTRRQTLRKNLAGELVIEREIFSGDSASVPAMSEAPKFIFWNRAVREAATEAAIDSSR